jgi:hypothetical protein
MAFVSGEGMRPSSSSNGIPNGISDQQAQSQVGKNKKKKTYKIRLHSAVG